MLVPPAGSFMLKERSRTRQTELSARGTVVAVRSRAEVAQRVRRSRRRRSSPPRRRCRRGCRWRWGHRAARRAVLNPDIAEVEVGVWVRGGGEPFGSHGGLVERRGRQAGDPEVDQGAAGHLELHRLVGGQPSGMPTKLRVAPVSFCSSGRSLSYQVIALLFSNRRGGRRRRNTGRWRCVRSSTSGRSGASAVGRGRGVVRQVGRLGRVFVPRPTTAGRCCNGAGRRGRWARCPAASTCPPSGAPRCGCRGPDPALQHVAEAGGDRADQFQPALS